MAIKTYKLKNVKNKKASEHFYYREFACPGFDKLKLDSNLPLYLEALFFKLGASKAVITSGYRTPAYSVSIGGTATDRHTQGMAADVVFYNASGAVISPIVVCCAAEDLGFIGGVARIGKTATHIDTRPTESRYFGDETKGYNSIWYYKPGSTGFYDYFGISKPKERFIKYTVKKNVVSRKTPFKLKGNKAARFKKGATVKVLKNGRAAYDKTVFFKIKYAGKYYYINRKYLKKASS